MSQAFSRLRPANAIDSGTIEALKWLAFASMTVDHVNRHLLNSAYPIMFHMGRLAMPLFIFVLAYNLARPEALSNGAAQRVLRRLVPFAILSSLPYMELNLAPIGWRPLNILFTLAAGIFCIILIRRPGIASRLAAVVLFGMAGWLVEYGWAAIGMLICAWHFFRAPNLFWSSATIILMILRGFEDGSHWLLTAIPVMGLGYYVRIDLPRWRNALYYFYPFHLAVIVVLKIMIFGNE